jgi:phosphoglycerate kinase
LELSGIEIGVLNHDFLVNELGKSWHQTVETAKSLLRDFGSKIHLPVDVAANVEDNRVDLEVSKLPIDAPIFDLGIQSIRNLSAAIKSAGTVHLNGPAGVFELPDFAFGTIEMLNACAETKGYVVVGGGHTATLISKYGLSKNMGHLSTGGGACLDYIAGKTLPAIASLEASAEAFTLNIARSVDQ